MEIVLTGSPGASGSSPTRHGQMALRGSATPIQPGSLREPFKEEPGRDSSGSDTGRRMPNLQASSRRNNTEPGVVVSLRLGRPTLCSEPEQCA